MQRFRGGLLVPGALALTLRLIYLFGAAHNPLFAHLDLDPPANGAPLYGQFLAAVRSIFGPNPFVPRLLQALMGTGAAMLLGATASRLWGTRAGMFAAVVAALYGPLIYFEGELAPVSLEIFLTTLSIHFTVRAGLDRSTRTLVLAGLALSASAVTRPTVLPFALVVIVWLLWLRIGVRRIGLYAAAVAFLPLLVVAGNGLAGREYVPGARPGAASSHETPAVVGSHGADRAPGKAAALYARNLALVWNRRELPDDQDQQFFAPFNSWLFRSPWLLGFWFLAPVALVTAFAERRTAPILGGYLLCTTLTVAAFFVSDRFRLPLVVGMIPLAGAGLDRFVAILEGAMGQSGGKPAAALMGIARSRGRILVALGLVTVAVSAPFPSLQPTESGTGWFRLARAYESAGDLNVAGAAYEKAELEGMRTADFYTTWASFEMNRRLGIQAGQHLLRAVALDPSHGPAHEKLAEIYTDRGDWEFAAQEYAVAAGLIPDRAAELYTSAGALYAQIGRTDAAADMFEKALAIRPGFAPAEEGLAQLRAGKRGEAEIPKPKIWSLAPR